MQSEDNTTEFLQRCRREFEALRSHRTVEFRVAEAGGSGSASFAFYHGRVFISVTMDRGKVDAMFSDARGVLGSIFLSQIVARYAPTDLLQHALTVEDIFMFIDLNGQPLEDDFEALARGENPTRLNGIAFTPPIEVLAAIARRAVRPT